MRAASLFLLLLYAAPNLYADPPASGQPVKTDPAIEKLIEDLGSASFPQREQAAKELEALGAPALQHLQKLPKGNDEEVNVRVSRLVCQLQEQAMTASLLAPKMVHFKVQDVSVSDAVARLREMSGLKIDLIGDLTGLPQKFTLDTGKVTAWQALHQLCDKAGLAEQVPVAPTASVSTRFRTPAQQQPQGPNRNIILHSSAAPSPPTSFHGSIRLRALPPSLVGQAAPGEIRLALEAVAEMRLQGFGIVDALCFDRAIDEHGQHLELLAENPLANQTMAMQGGNGNRVMIINGNMVPSGGQQQQLQRTMVFRFKQGAKAARTLKELSGKVLVQALSPLETLAVIKDVRHAAGRTARARDGATLRVDSVENLDDNALRLRVTLESPAETGMPQNPFGNNVVILNGNFNGNINGVQFMNGMPINTMPANYPRLVDAQGKKYVAEVSNPRPQVNNGQVSRQVTLTYRPEAEAKDLVLEGQRNILFAVPISLKDIPLP